MVGEGASASGGTLTLDNLFSTVSFVVQFTGWIANRGLADHPPRAGLRQET